MIHVLTVHWQCDKWVDVQLDYLRTHIQQPFKTYAFLNMLPAEHGHKYDYHSTEQIRSHAIKLNLLADIAGMNADHDDDWLIFIDGDAFPIGSIVSFAAPILNSYPLIAIQRLENGGDIQPHPSFCLTTVGLWKQIKGDWKSGYRWTNATGKQISDVGGNLLAAIERHNISWLPLNRSNKKELHPLWFGIYHDLIYHHGAGFRTPTSRIDRQSIFASTTRLGIYLPESILRKLFWYSIRKRIDKNMKLSEKIYRSIQSNPDFYKIFTDEETSLKNSSR